MQKDTNRNIEFLKKEVERTIGFELKTPKDFKTLRNSIKSRIDANVSESTLMRMWGYIHSKSNTSEAVLDTLSRYIGYKNYEHFSSQHQNKDSQSTPIFGKHLNVEDDLKEDDEIIITWRPERICRVRYLGNKKFIVLNSEKTRICTGDTFKCGLFIANEPLYITELKHGDNATTTYVCGKIDGIRWEKVEK